MSSWSFPDAIFKGLMSYAPFMLGSAPRANSVATIFSSYFLRDIALVRKILASDSAVAEQSPLRRKCRGGGLRRLYSPVRLEVFAEHPERELPLFVIGEI